MGDREESARDRSGKPGGASSSSVTFPNA